MSCPTGLDKTRKSKIFLQNFHLCENKIIGFYRFCPIQLDRKYKISTYFILHYDAIWVLRILAHQILNVIAYRNIFLSFAKTKTLYFLFYSWWCYNQNNYIELRIKTFVFWYLYFDPAKYSHNIYTENVRCSEKQFSSILPKSKGLFLSTYFLTSSL